MKKAVLLLAGFVALIGTRIYIGTEASPVELPAETPTELHAGPVVNVARKLLVSYGLNEAEAEREIPRSQKFQRSMNAGVDAFVAEWNKPIAKSVASKAAVEVESTPEPAVVEAPEIQPVSQYKAAYNSAKESGKPLIVLITADWCEWCHKLERESIAPLRANGELDDCEYIVLDLDHDKEAKQIVGKQSIPVLMRYQFTNGKWQASKMAGYKPKDEVLSFLKGSK